MFVMLDLLTKKTQRIGVYVWYCLVIHYEPSFTCYPVDSNALHSADAISDHVLSPRLVSLGPANGAQAHVHPIDGVIVCENQQQMLFKTNSPPYPFTATYTKEDYVNSATPERQNTKMLA